MDSGIVGAMGSQPNIGNTVRGTSFVDESGVARSQRTREERNCRGARFQRALQRSKNKEGQVGNVPHVLR
jgi:hypothetical protein